MLTFFPSDKGMGLRGTAYGRRLSEGLRLRAHFISLLNAKRREQSLTIVVVVVVVGSISANSDKQKPIALSPPAAPLIPLPSLSVCTCAAELYKLFPD